MARWNPMDFCGGCNCHNKDCLCVEDPILDIRLAISAALNDLGVQKHEQRKLITDRAVDLLPDYFRSPMQKGTS